MTYFYGSLFPPRNQKVTVQCIRDGQFVVVVARDVTLPRLSLDSVRLLGGNNPPCAPVESTPYFAIYQFPVTACGTSMMEDSGYVVYENRMTSSYEVGIGPFGSITRDSHFELLFQCRYSGTSVEACPYQDDCYLTTLVPVTGSSGLQFPTHYKRFVVKMFTFVDPASLAPLQETVFIHCSTEVCHPSSGFCEQSCTRKRRDTHIKDVSSEQTVVSSGEVTLVM
ncbi:zona pellucida sperm-binding protein 4-like [Sinocyclocheilus rhinocerous]|uniref:zona pellucida sperm-binding protein 4-like n=1 Tax=Sinocyclocheilus rhinocerous TaxID=307959 RepID=UPI0007B7FCC3|nr:PREDICTED: zona pellucida sperm-binding protein 4-like [Sinocyclocheilus rhinocerous]